MVAHWWHDEVIAPIVLEHLDIRSLTAMEVTSAFQADPLHMLQRAFYRMARTTGAVCYSTGVTVGEGRNPKTELLGWLHSRSAFLEPKPCPPAFTLGSLAAGKAPSLLETLPIRSGSAGTVELHTREDSYTSRSSRQLPRSEQPLVPLAFGVREGFPLYVEFRLAWEEHGNGEACQLGLELRSSGKVLNGDRDRSAACTRADGPHLRFSPSAGAVFQGTADSCLRGWPLEDLWVDAEAAGTCMELHTGVYVSEGGKISFYRRGPFSGRHKGTNAQGFSWEVTASFDPFPRGQLQEGAVREYFVMLCLLDRCTPLQAELAQVALVPPVEPPATEFAEWRSDR